MCDYLEQKGTNVMSDVKYYNYSVSKGNEFIVTGKFNCSLNEQKLLLILISTIQPDDESLMRQTFKIKELAELLGIDPTSIYSELRNLTRNLVKAYIEVEHEGVLIQTHLVTTARHERGKGLLTMQLCEDLKPFYLQLQNRFTTYKLKYILKLHSKYSIRFYELFKCYINQGQEEFSCSIQYLKDLMVLTQKSYERYSDFHRKVLKPAVKEINESTDLSVTYKEVKEGRKVVGLFFQVKLKASHRVVEPPPIPTPLQHPTIRLERIQNYIAKITGVTISLEEANKICLAEETSSSTLTEAYQVLNGQTRNPVGSLLKYLKDPTSYGRGKEKPQETPYTQGTLPLATPSIVEEIFRIRAELGQTDE